MKSRELGGFLALAVIAGFVSAACGEAWRPAPTANGPSGCGAEAAATVEASYACATRMPTLPPGGISRDEAIAAALRLAPASAGQPTVVWAMTDSNPFAPLSTADRGLVWEVRLQGSFAASPCPARFLERLPSPSDPACLDVESGLGAVIDIYTGALIGWLH